MSTTQNLIADLYYERTRIWNNDDVLRDVRTKCVQAADDLARLMAENELQKGALEDLETLIVVCNTIDQTAKKVMINLIRAALKGEQK